MTRPGATEDVPCNLCGAAPYDIVGRVDREGGALQTVMCRACGLVWINPRPPAGEMDRYYATEYRADYTGDRAPRLRKILRGMRGAQDRRRALDPLLRDRAAETSEPLHILDVGCGAGELLYLLRRERLEVSGLEPGREYAEFARRVLGVQVQTATVEGALVAPASQDVVTLFHCLEHVPDPRRVLTIVRGWVKAGGAVVVEVPNVESTVQAPAHRFHYAHLYHFSGATLGALGESAGLRCLRTFYSHDGGNVTCWFRRQDDEERRPAGLEAQAARTRAILATHTSLRHYLSATPYRRTLDRLRRRLHEDHLLRRLKSVDDVLRWASWPVAGGR